MSENDIVERLRAVLKAVIDDIHEYERINNLSPNPPRTECWDSVADALVVLEETDTAAKRMCVRGETQTAADCRAMAAKLRGET